MQLLCGKCSRILEYSGDRPSFCAYCGQSLADAPADATADYAAGSSLDTPTQPGGDNKTPPPKTIGGYRLLRLLGSGGMGAVYEAEEIATGRRAALKLIAASHTSSPDAVERFRQEGRLANMVGHPRCVFVKKVDEEVGRHFIVMELMTGSTLKDLVEQHGPLPPDQAIAKILDVIDGLQEAHRLEVIHRDVKPSNCFLEANGRVKVGDFGLAKSLVGSTHLTRTGAFLGTPDYASPEQVRGETIDAQTDVYSVAATLYYLLTGRPPFCGSDAAATLARIVSDPLPPMRSLRPDMPKALDQIVLRGLERDRKRRYRDLEEMRVALAQFVPRPLTRVCLGLRVGACVIDLILFMIVAQLVGLGMQFALKGSALAETVIRTSRVGLVEYFGFLVYIAVAEGLTGCTLGKKWLRLRVWSTSDSEPGGIAKAGVRAVVFVSFAYGGFIALLVITLIHVHVGMTDQELLNLHFGLDFLHWLWLGAGSALLVSSMRAKNGFRGLHELCSGTRVIQLPWQERRKRFESSSGWLLYCLRHGLHGAPASGIPEQVGHFAIRGAVRSSPDEKFLLGEDPTLKRGVMIWLRPQSAAPLDARRQEVARKTRLRWLLSGNLSDGHWDAFLAPLGAPLPELVAREGQLQWPEVRHLLVELLDELSAACADGTIPPTLSTEQVWVHSDGRVQLADWSFVEKTNPNQTTPPAAEARALQLLREVCVLALEGQRRETPEPIAAPIPRHSRKIVDALTGGTASLTQLRADFEATKEFATEVTSTIRAGQLALLTGAMVLAISALGFSVYYCQTIMLDAEAVRVLRAIEKGSPPVSVAKAEAAQGSLFRFAAAASIALGLWPVLWISWAYLFYGGWSLHFTCVQVVDKNGRRASRMRCGLRAMVVWLPALVILTIAPWWPYWLNRPALDSFNTALAGHLLAVLALFVLYLVLAFVFPRRGLHDWIAGTYLTPL